MNYRIVLVMLGGLLVALSLVMLVPAGVGLYLGEPQARAFLIAAAISAGVGIAVERSCRGGPEAQFRRGEAFVLVSATWVMASIVGALPYVLIKGPGFLVDGLFESVSGFTTTGASVLPDVEGESRALLMWRSLTQWLGGMGIIVLGIAVLPRLAIGGMQLLDAEAPGPVAEKLTPRIASSAKALWGIYLLFTVSEIFVLLLMGVPAFDAVNHGLTTAATGGFSTRAASIGAFSGPVQMVVMVFMILGAINFALHFDLLRGRTAGVRRNTELRVFLALLGLVTALLTFDLAARASVEWPEALRLAAFQATTFLTTTGYASADFDAWPSLSRALLFTLMFVGGCAGSTSGSVKVVRVIVVFKKIAIELRRLRRPRAVLPLRLNRQVVTDEVANQVMTFFLLFVGLVAAGGLALALTGLDPISALAASTTALSNIGPAFGDLGPANTLEGLPTAAKLIMMMLMVVGRLELYTLLVALYLAGRSLV